MKDLSIYTPEKLKELSQGLSKRITEGLDNATYQVEDLIADEIRRRPAKPTNTNPNVEDEEDDVLS